MGLMKWRALSINSYHSPFTERQLLGANAATTML
jgi:hypothetical protein